MLAPQTLFSTSELYVVMQILLNREGSFQGGCVVAMIFVIAAAIGSWVLAFFLLREATAKLSQ